MDCVKSLFKKKKKDKAGDYEPAVSQVESRAKAVPRIYRLLIPSIPTSQQLTGGSTSPPEDTSSVLDKSLSRFGPIYGSDDEYMTFAKKKAWEHVRYKSPGEDMKLTEEEFSAAVRKLEKQARETYSSVSPAVKRFQFREMMIKDGCFFLQLAFMILGKSHVELGYAKTDLVFGVGRDYNKKREYVDKWMEAMFFVGNQIPLVVLEALLKQEFFQNIIKEGRIWKPPGSDLRKRVLYELLVLPHQTKSPADTTTTWLRFPVKVTRTGATPSRVEPQPSDVLHGLQTLVLGPHPTGHKSGRYDAQFDLEAASYNSYDDGTGGGGGDNVTGRIFPSAKELKQSRIRIKKLKNGAGPRSIHFKSYYFWANLYLPILTVQEDTEVVLRTLKNYEISNQQLGKQDREVVSYINLLSDLIQTPHDLRLLQKKGVIEGRPTHADKLLGIVRRLNSKDETVTYNLQNVRRKITNYSSPLVLYQGILNLVMFLTIMQTIFTVLSYLKPPT